MFRMNSDIPSVVRTGPAAAGTSQHPSRSDHVHSSLGMSQILFSLVDANMNITTDQVFTKGWAFDDYLITEIRGYDASGNLTTAAGGIYDTASKAGDPIVAAAQVYTVLSAATEGLSLTLAAKGKDKKSADNLYLALTTAQGSAMTASFQVIGIPLTAL